MHRENASSDAPEAKMKYEQKASNHSTNHHHSTQVRAVELNQLKPTSLLLLKLVIYIT
jgi:hypothetical protein